MKANDCDTGTKEQQTAAASNKKGLFSFSRLFRSKSADSKKKVLKSAASTTRNTSPKRRFVRVVRDNEHVGEEYQNPHVIRRYTQGFWEEQNLRKASSLEDTSRPLPYTVSGHTILKKPSTDPDCLGHKRATFKNEVQVVEFSRLEKTVTCKRMTRSMPLMTIDRALNEDRLVPEPSSEVSLENSVDDSDDEQDVICERTPDEQLHNDCCTADESSGSSDSEQQIDELCGGQFASLVAADEKDMCTKQLKRKHSSSSNSDSSQLALES